MADQKPKLRPLKAVGPRKVFELKPELDRIAFEVEQRGFIDDDPIGFMHQYSGKIDQELAGFFAAIMAWGRRDIVISKVGDALQRMDHKPATFIGNFSDSDADALAGFKHRTFTDGDLYWLITGLKRILDQFGEFEAFWTSCYQQAQSAGIPLTHVFHRRFFDVIPEAPQRTGKHVSSSAKNSSCKRLWMYLRWCIRQNSPVDPGIMQFMPQSELMIPLDVHVGRYARSMGLLTRHQNDWKSVVELTERLRKLDPTDPAKYDFALFGMGVLDVGVADHLLINRLDR